MDRLVLILFGLLVLLQIGDVWTTDAAFKTVPGVYEKNDLLVRLFDRFGRYPTLIASKLIVIACLAAPIYLLFAIEWMPEWARISAIVMLAALDAFYAKIVIANFKVLYQ